MSVFKNIKFLGSLNMAGVEILNVRDVCVCAGGIGGLCPDRQKDLAKLGLRAYVQLQPLTSS